MLVLSRQKGEAILIDGKRIVVTVVEIRGNLVRLGIEASRETPVLRKEVYEAMRRNGEQPHSLADSPADLPSPGFDPIHLGQ